MRRHAHPLFTLCSAVSLLLCLSACVAWARSHRVHDVITIIHQSRRVGGGSVETIYVLESAKGGVGLARTQTASARNASNLSAGWHFSHQTFTGLVYPNHGRKTVGGFVLHTEAFAASTFSQNTGVVTLTYWSLVVATIVLPVASALPIFQRRWRAQMYLCPRCGYDLRASPKRCPECGTAKAVGE